MQEALELYVADWCDHCEWVETYLRKKKPDVEVFDCKLVVNRPGYVRAVSRRTGDRHIQEAPAIPFLLERGPKPRAYVGAPAVLKAFGGTEMILMGD